MKAKIIQLSIDHGYVNEQWKTVINAMIKKFHRDLLFTNSGSFTYLKVTTKANGASFDNNAKSCFDHIVMPLASLILQNMGMPKRVCEFSLMILHNMMYFIKLRLGYRTASILLQMNKPFTDQDKEGEDRQQFG
jgi:hypothetical protein